MIVVASTSQLFLAFIAGSLTTLSPCVLPILPFVLGSSAAKNRLAPALICAGLFAAFVTFGWTLSAFGSSLGVELSTVRIASAILFGFFGLSLVITKISDFLSRSLERLSNHANRKISDLKTESSLGYFFLGALLGGVWSPCSGPTLGAAVVLAAQSDGKLSSLLIMVSFGIGAVTPLLLVAYGAKDFLKKNQFYILSKTQLLKKIAGCVMIAVSVLTLTSVDKKIEAAFVNALPDVWIDLTTRF